MDASGWEHAVLRTLPAGMREVVTAPMAGRQAAQYVEEAYARDLAVGQHSPHGVRVLRREIARWPRVWRGTVALGGVVLAGHLMLLGVALVPVLAPLGILVALAGVPVLAVSAVWGSRVVRDGRRAKRAFSAWWVAGDAAAQEAVYAWTPRRHSWRGFVHAALTAGAFLLCTWWIAYLAQLGNDDLDVAVRVGVALAALVGMGGSLVALVALAWTPWQMLRPELR